MKFKLFFIFFIFCLAFMSFVCAEDCFGMSASCPEGFYVNCWEDETSYNWNCKSIGGEIGPSILPNGEKWCNDGYVIDYITTQCCPMDFPYQNGNACHIFPFDAPAAKNYFTERFNCTPNERKCEGFYQYSCLDTTSKNQNLYYDWWKDNRLLVGRCGYQVCFVGDTKCEGIDFYECENNNWKKTGPAAGKCSVECTTDSDCPEDTEATTLCEDRVEKVGYIDNYCEDFSCKKKANYKFSEAVIGKCDAECLKDSDCKEPKLISQFCVNGIITSNSEIETCENYQCVPDTIVSEKTKIGECGFCEKDSDCGENRTTGKYWKDRKAYYDEIYPKCLDQVCKDIVTPIDLDEQFETDDLDIDYKESLLERFLVWIRSFL